MIDIHAFQKACKWLAYRIRDGRSGAVYMGGHQLLITTVYGDSVIIDSRHLPSLKLCNLPSPKQIAILCLMEHHIRPTMRCADIGAGCGYHSLMLATLAGKEGQVYSFERNPDYFTLLERNISSNGHASVVCVNSSEGLDQYFTHAEDRLEFIHISPEEDLPQTFYGMWNMVDSSPFLSLLCYIDPALLSQHGFEFDRLFSALDERGYEGYLLPQFDLLTAKEQLLQGLSVKSLFLCR